MMKKLPGYFLFGAVLLLLSCERTSNQNTSAPDPGAVPENVYQGGDTTVFDSTTQAFAFPAPALEGERLELHLRGDLAFESSFVAAPAEVNPGLGPLFNNVSCEGCHPNDGRGKPPVAGEQFHSMFLRMSRFSENAAPTESPIPVPGYGTQLFDKAIFGTTAQGQMQITYEEITEEYPDGTTYALLHPQYSIQDSYLPLPDDLVLSARVAPPVFGRGLLELIPQNTVLAGADEQDADGDGISGKPNMVWDFASQALALGRFGWKGENPSVLQQSAGAYRGDMGITNPYFPRESVAGEVQDDGNLDDPELDEDTLAEAVFYVQTLSVPARRNWDDETVKKGERLFEDANCSGCHTPRVETGPSESLPELANQTIFPYTDTLLHDMGTGLADGRPVFAANGQEWKTPALWGIGKTGLANGHTRFLHDGRARNLEEAILWHGGEGEESVVFFKGLSSTDRQALIAFLQSL